MVERKILYVALITVFAAACPRLIAQIQGLEYADQWGKAFDGVQLALYLDPHPPENSSKPLLRIAIRNGSTSSKAIALGYGCGNVNPTNNITLEAEDEQGQKYEFQDATANLPCQGRLQLFEVALPAGGDFSTPISLRKYGNISPVTHAFEAGFRPGGDYVITAAILFDGSKGFDVPYLIPLSGSPSYETPYQIPIANIPERLRSNELRVEVPAQ